MGKYKRVFVVVLDSFGNDSKCVYLVAYTS